MENLTDRISTNLGLSMQIEKQKKQHLPRLRTIENVPPINPPIAAP